jgi:hypothetical protein
VESRQRRNILAFALGSEEPAQGGLDKLRHCAFLPRCLTLELSHDRVVDIESRLHMENHITNKAVWKRYMGVSGKMLGDNPWSGPGPVQLIVNLSCCETVQVIGVNYFLHTARISSRY